MNGLGDCWRQLSHELMECYAAEEARTLSMLLICDALKVSKSQVLINHPYPFQPSVLEQLNAAIKRLKNYEPIQYVLGHTWFHDLLIQIKPGALIPRPETEELVALITERHQNSMSALLDVCSGSGCISLALKKYFPETEVYAWEISEEALAIAKQNASQLSLSVTFQQRDVLQLPWPSDQTFDLIVSNPPYVCFSEKSAMLPNVLEFEPHLALFVDDEDPVVFYRTIFRESFQLLKPGGWLYFETNPKFVDTIQQAMHWYGYSQTEVISDFRGMKRFVCGRKNEVIFP
ncbi:MAG: peptide chain release factor N(5)-glutamine methyltransferase [Cytophagaceae bacterium]|jgi:release factor glutamine methyltransferase|nr:peptide chain release factor N(5)-glutamine methyltransferase [Cytophagaceae bacterium]